MELNPNEEVLQNNNIKKSRWWWRRWQQNVTTDENAPLYYSERAIYAFSVFFMVFFGAVLLALNLRKINKKVAWQILLFGILYTIFQILILSKLGNGANALSFGFNIMGASLLDLFFWKKYIGINVKYRAKPIWKPFIVGIIVTGLFLSAMIYEDRINKQNPVLSPADVSLQNQIEKEETEFLAEANNVSASNKNFSMIFNNREVSKIHDAFQDLLIKSQALQPKLNEVKSFLQQNISNFSNEEARQEAIRFSDFMDTRDLYNRKLTEFATFGVSVKDWANPSKTEVDQLVKIMDELAALGKEMDVKLN